MDNYDVNIKDGMHTVEITLQYGTRKSTFFTEIGGNCKGSAIISECVEDWVHDLERDEETYLIEIVFDEGLKTETTIGFDDVDDILDHVVGVRIVDFTEGDY